MKKRILCYGDSNTWGYDAATGGRFDEGVRWTGILASLLGDGFAVVEEGCGGRTTARRDDVDWYCDGRAYLYPCMESHNPLDLVILMLGTNDLKYVLRANAFYSAAGIRELIVTIRGWALAKKKPCPPILVVSPIEITQDVQNTQLREVFAAPNVIEQSKLFAHFMRQTAEEWHCSFLSAADCATACREDGIHLDAQGHSALAQAIYHKTIEILGESIDESGICKGSVSV